MEKDLPKSFPEIIKFIENYTETQQKHAIRGQLFETSVDNFEKRVEEYCTQMLKLNARQRPITNEQIEKIRATSRARLEWIRKSSKWYDNFKADHLNNALKKEEYLYRTQEIIVRYLFVAYAGAFTLAFGALINLTTQSMPAVIFSLQQAIYILIFGFIASCLYALWDMKLTGADAQHSYELANSFDPEGVKKPLILKTKWVKSIAIFLSTICIPYAALTFVEKESALWFFNIIRNYS